MKIGRVEVGGRVRLAPMAGATNAPFRLIARECGSGLTTSEEIDAGSLLQDGNPHAAAIAAHCPGERPLALQLLGAHADVLARATERAQVLGADIVDLNMGCPMPRITGKGKGAALMRDLGRTALLLRAMRKAASVPLTVKMRGGWDDAHVNAVEVAQMAESEGVDAITVHPRTQSQRYAGKAPWQIIGEVVAAVGIPVTGNGDVRSLGEARRMMAETGCASVMIGRGALGRPWVFDEAFDALPPATRRERKLAVITRHLALIRAHLPERRALVQTQKHLAWYADGLPHATDCRARLFRCATADDAWAAFVSYWDAGSPGEPVLVDTR